MGQFNKKQIFVSVLSFKEETLILPKLIKTTSWIKLTGLARGPDKQGLAVIISFLVAIF